MSYSWKVYVHPSTVQTHACEKNCVCALLSLRHTHTPCWFRVSSDNQCSLKHFLLYLIWHARVAWAWSSNYIVSWLLLLWLSSFCPLVLYSHWENWTLLTRDVSWAALTFRVGCHQTFKWTNWYLENCWQSCFLLIWSLRSEATAAPVVIIDLAFHRGGLRKVDVISWIRLMWVKRHPGPTNPPPTHPACNSLYSS